ncbi:OmpW/AlkL family protein [Moraxella oblonga]|uniref:OmpW/AlkL family protein n=1 Tax=Moraxella oblonga TaxID=200413 RepID=UPI000836F9E0|nr:OmpW family outer membrane protein [Moraxella oblonga]
MFKKLLLVAGVVAVASSASANLTFKAGVGYLDPTADKDINTNLTKAEVSSEAALLPSFDYRFGTSPFSAELLLATPFEHTVKVGDDKTEIAKFKHLPPTVTFKYNTPEFAGGVSANVGVGATVLVPYEEYLTDGTKLKADTTVAPAAQVGISYSPKKSPWGVFADVRYVDLKTDLKLDGNKIGELEVNPIVYSIGVSHKF